MIGYCKSTTFFDFTQKFKNKIFSQANKKRIFVAQKPRKR